MIRLQSAILAIALTSLLPATATAYSFTCSPETDHTIATAAPNVYIMLDKSGSMNNPSTVAGLTRLEAANLAVDEVTRDRNTVGPCAMPGVPTCDEVRFGLGTFSAGASTQLPVKEDSNVVSSYEIFGQLPSSGSGWTDVGAAAENIRDEGSLAVPGGTNIGILISDGGPSRSCSNSGAIDTSIEAVNALCDAKLRTNNPVLTFSVGFGTDSSADTNALFAAAGGTGSCCQASDCADNPIDVCALTNTELSAYLEGYNGGFPCPLARLKGDFACTGSIEATDPADLKTALKDITATAQCTFPLDIPPGYPGGTALEDTDATKVRIEHTFTTPGLIELPNAGEPGDFDSDLDDDFETGFGVAETTADPYEDEGWYFSDVSRRFVTLTPRLCNDIQTSDITSVRTQVSCACTNSGPCTITGGGWTPTQLANMRCAQGTWQCVGGVDTCVPNGSDQPEICNGLDDDCDGIVDNIQDSWEKPAYSSITLPADHLGVDCNRLNSCSCPLGMKDDHAGTDFDTYLDNWDPVCQCGGGLAAPEDASGPPEVHLDDDAACATGDFGDAAPFGLAFLIFAGGVVIRRRRL